MIKVKKRVLITGADSYIGVSFENWVKGHHADEFVVDTVDTIDGSWRRKDFSTYDCVFHVAGIAHADVGNTSEERKQFYYKINRDLAVETAEKAKKSGVKQFVFMSSAIIYGESASYGRKRLITADTEPSPANFYGDSKWQADIGVRTLQDESFNVAVLRPPMIYGNGSKGNYPTLAKMARRLPVFPNVDNERSMLYIDNLTEFLCQLIMSGRGGVFFPQNAEYTKTADMVREIAAVSNHKIWITRAFNWAVALASLVPGKIGGLVNKAFGSMTYDQTMSVYDFEYQVVDLKTSIKETEVRD